MKERRNACLMVFAHVPPPEHGQSRMVAEMLEALRGGGIGAPKFAHVDARVSDGLGDVGGISAGKLFRLGGYIAEALRARFWKGSRVLYYVPGPVKWSAVVRDWVVLFFLRPWFRRLVFHWHAIGQGEWAHGSERRRLPGPGWLDGAARMVSRFFLRRPDVSIVVSPTSDADAREVRSGRIEVVRNGLEDPCPDFDGKVAVMRSRRSEELGRGEALGIRVLFLSRGTEEKGIFDALDAVEAVSESRVLPAEARLELMFAGGVEESVEVRFRERVDGLLRRFGGDRINVATRGYVKGEEKAECFRNADLFLAPSRWESFGLTVAEAMAWGVPVAGAASDGVRGVLPEGYAWLGEPGNAGSLAEVFGDACRALLRGEGWTVGRELRATFVDKFGIERFRREICAVLAEACRE